jgi:hypothetical protein
LQIAEELVHGIRRHDLLKDLPGVDWNQSKEHSLESVEIFIHSVHDKISQETELLGWRIHMLEKEKTELREKHTEVEKEQLRRIFPLFFHFSSTFLPSIPFDSI